MDLHHVRKKHPGHFDCNIKKDHQLLIIFDTNISDTTGDQMTVQFSIAPIVCICTTWVNKTNDILHFCPILPVRVFPGSAETDIW